MSYCLGRLSHLDLGNAPAQMQRDPEPGDDHPRYIPELPKRGFEELSWAKLKNTKDLLAAGHTMDHSALQKMMSVSLRQKNRTVISPDAAAAMSPKASKQADFKISQKSKLQRKLDKSGLSHQKRLQTISLDTTSVSMHHKTGQAFFAKIPTSADTTTTLADSNSLFSPPNQQFRRSHQQNPPGTSRNSHVMLQES